MTLSQNKPIQKTNTNNNKKATIKSIKKPQKSPREHSKEDNNHKSITHGREKQNTENKQYTEENTASEKKHLYIHLYQIQPLIKKKQKRIHKKTTFHKLCKLYLALNGNK